MVAFNYKRVIIDLFKHCTLIVAMDGGLVLQERQYLLRLNSEGLTHTYITKKIISDHDL